MKLISLEEAVDFLKRAKVVAIPTETVYGLAANAFSDTAVSQERTIKTSKKKMS